MFQLIPRIVLACVYDQPLLQVKVGDFAFSSELQVERQLRVGGGLGWIRFVFQA